ncbi:MAG: MarR family winged helix-turn-helix transcriptional regulator [Candidatus Saccharimonadales bacterium]
MSPTDNIGYLLQHVAGVLFKQSDQALQEQLGVGFSQYKILRVLQSTPGARQKQIADWLGQTEASISRQVRLLKERGLLRIEQSPKSRREHMLELTIKGERIIEESVRVLNKAQQGVFDDLGPKRQERLHEILSFMHQEVCQSNKIGSCSHPFNL